MIRLIGLWLVGCALCVTPVAADFSANALCRLSKRIGGFRANSPL